MPHDRRLVLFRPYRLAQLEARRRALGLSRESMLRVAAAIRVYSGQLARMLENLPVEEQAAIRRAQTILRAQIAPQLRASLTHAVTSGRDTAFRDILGIQTDAALSVAQATDIPDRLLGAIRRPNVSLAGAWESLGHGAASWKTLLPQYTGRALQDVQQVVTTALTEGVSPDQLARRIRGYVEGSASIQDTLKGMGEVSDRTLRRLEASGQIDQQDARRLRYNSDRIAFSEVHNARGEAEIQAYAADPFVKAVRWELSPDRGTQTTPDVCDALAETDFYGLGAGIYPVSQVPISPHPFDRCERVPVTRPSNQASQPKPNPALQLAPSGARITGKITEGAKSRILQQVSNVLAGTRASPAPEKLAQLASQAAA